MTHWHGFFVESQSYCGYAAKTPYEKLRWWLFYPRAWLGFHWMGIKHVLMRTAVRLGWIGVAERIWNTK